MTAREKTIESMEHAAQRGDLPRLERLARKLKEPPFHSWVMALRALHEGDHARGRGLLEEAASDGCIPARNSLAALYRAQGIDDPRKRKKAIELYEVSAREGSVAAMEKCFELCLGERKGCPRDLDRSLYWLEQACRRGSKAALDFAERYGRKREDVAAVSAVTETDLAELAADGHPELLLDYAYGSLYGDGFGTSAAGALRRLASSGNAEAAALLCCGFVGHQTPYYAGEPDRMLKIATATRKADYLLLLSDLMDDPIFGCGHQMYRDVAETAARESGPNMLFAAAQLLLRFVDVDVLDGGAELDSAGQWADARRALGWLEEGMRQGDPLCSVAFADNLLALASYEPGATSEVTLANEWRALNILQEQIAGGNADAAIALVRSDCDVLIRAGDPQVLQEMTEACLALVRSVALDVEVTDENDGDLLEEYAQFSLMLGTVLASEDEAPRAVTTGLRLLDLAAEVAAERGLDELTAHALSMRGDCLLSCGRRDEAAACYREAARRGALDVYAKMAIALLGNSKTANREVRALFERSIAEGDPSGLYFVGAALLSGSHGYHKDPRAGLRLLEKSVATGNSYAALTLGMAFSQGKSLPVDFDFAKHYFEQAASLGNPEAAGLLELLATAVKEQARRGEAASRVFH